MQKLLNIDDNGEILNQLKWGFKKHYQVLSAGSAAEALDLFVKQRPSVITLDLGLPPDPDGVEEGMRCLAEIMSTDPTTKVIVITGKGEKENALRAISLGAYDFYPKPINLTDLKVILDRAFHVVELEKENRRLQCAAGEGNRLGEIIGASQPMLEVFNLINKISGSDVPVLILGESGTGKELVARAIHQRSNRCEKPFIAINCGAIPANLLEAELFGHEKGSFTGAHARVLGKVEYADKGSLFLDEIGEMPASLQVNLLRFLQEKVIQRVGGRENISTDTRVIAATNIDIDKSIASGAFREDLYYRLGVITIKLPPLRDRREDIPLLSQYLLQRFGQDFGKKIRGFSKSAMDALLAYQWPGNVRELENKIKRAAIMAEGALVLPEDLGFQQALAQAADEEQAPYQSVSEEPGEIQLEPLSAARSRLELKLLRKAIESSEGNIARAAESLGISRPTFYDLMKKHSLKV